MFIARLFSVFTSICLLFSLLTVTYGQDANPEYETVTVTGDSIGEVPSVYSLAAIKGRNAKLEKTVVEQDRQIAELRYQLEEQKELLNIVLQKLQVTEENRLSSTTFTLAVAQILRLLRRTAAHQH